MATYGRYRVAKPTYGMQVGIPQLMEGTGWPSQLMGYHKLQVIWRASVAKGLGHPVPSLVAGRVPQKSH